jgi:hypothetical protein
VEGDERVSIGFKDTSILEKVIAGAMGDILRNVNG